MSYISLDANNFRIEFIYPIVTILKYALPQMNKDLVSCMLNILKYKHPVQLYIGYYKQK